MQFLNTVLNILFPIKCLSCGISGADLCLTCLADCPPAERESAKWIFPIFDYRHPPIKKALWFFKYKGKKGLANIFAEILYERILEEMADLSVLENFRHPLLIPIPLSPSRYRERGYNQAELLGRALVKIDTLRSGLDLKLENNILIKPKDTIHQAHIENRSERLRNIIGSFALKNKEENLNKIKNRNIILIDDITTTGATLTEAKKILKQHGARKIIAFTLAH
ncbi:MAG: phosphoribosyltransferase family protein [Patescibacteria group bacterium]